MLAAPHAKRSSKDIHEGVCHVCADDSARDLKDVDGDGLLICSRARFVVLRLSGSLAHVSGDCYARHDSVVRCAAFEYC